MDLLFRNSVPLPAETIVDKKFWHVILVCSNNIYRRLAIPVLDVELATNCADLSRIAIGKIRPKKVIKMRKKYLSHDLINL